MADTQSAVVKYRARDGQDITLSFDTIRRYLVQGKSEYVTPQEFMYFMGVAKSQGMNPFKRDCWLIKYAGASAAAIISAIGFLRSRAKAMSDCKGWQAGIIVKRGKEIIYSSGLMFDDDILLGGWARGKPEGWDEERMIEVNLKGYIKRTSEGKITQFWKEENQPTQIAKVAESQLLRVLWPDEFQNIYTDAEISPDDAIKGLPEISLTPNGQPQESQEPAQHLIDKFDVKASEQEYVNLGKLSEYLALCTRSKDGLTVDDVKASAMRQGFQKFWGFYESWLKNEKKAEPEAEKQSEPSSFVQQFINLKKGDAVKTGLVPAIMKKKPEILAAPSEDQEIIRKKFYTVYGPEVSYPLDPPGEKEPEDKPDPSPKADEETEEQKMLRLVDGAELTDHLDDKSMFVNCPEKQEGIKITAKSCQTCALRAKCPTFKKYDAWKLG
ncbi:MAG: hypothetical protein E3J56_13175 [Candidatus Aminicenantes bacterium]|nr:MAG: hypothetical protein E3J56_13175 [Candidatus Aminicenantes bacterium]